VNDLLDDTTSNEKLAVGNMTIILDTVTTIVDELTTLHTQLVALNSFVVTATLSPRMQVINCNDNVYPLANSDTNTIFVINSTSCVITVPTSPGFRARFVTSKALLDLSNTIRLQSGTYSGYIQSTQTLAFHSPGVNEDSIMAPCSITATTPGDFIEIEVVNSTYATVSGETKAFGFDWSGNC